eukprot:gene28511-31668_t
MATEGRQAIGQSGGLPHVKEVVKVMQTRPSGADPLAWEQNSRPEPARAGDRMTENLLANRQPAMDDVSKFLGSWIALRLLNGTKWIGILKDVDWEKSKLFLVKAHEMVLAVGEREPRLLPLGSKVFSGRDVHDLTLLGPDSVPQHLQKRGSDSYDPSQRSLTSPRTPAQNPMDQDENRSPNRAQSSQDAQKAWQAAAMAMYPTGRAPAQQLTSNQPPSGKDFAAPASHPTVKPHGGWPSQHEFATPNRANLPHSAGSASSNPSSSNASSAEPSTAPSLTAANLQGLSPDAIRQLIVQLSTLVQQKSASAAATAPLRDALQPRLPVYSSPAPEPTPSSTTPAPAAPIPSGPVGINMQQLALLKQLRHAVQVQALQQQAAQLLLQQPNGAPAAATLATLEAVLKLKQQQPQHHQGSLTASPHPSLAALLQCQMQMQQQKTAAPPVPQGAEDLTPIRVKKPSHKQSTPRASEVRGSPLPPRPSPRSAAADSKQLDSGLTSGMNFHRSTQHHAEAPAGPSYPAKSPTARPVLSTRQAWQLRALNDFVRAQVEDGTRDEKEAVSWLFDLELPLDDTLKKLWEWVGLGFITFADFEGYKADCIANEQEREAGVSTAADNCRSSSLRSKGSVDSLGQSHKPLQAKPPAAVPLHAQQRSPLRGNSGPQGPARGMMASPYARVKGARSNNAENIPPMALHTLSPSPMVLHTLSPSPMASPLNRDIMQRRGQAVMSSPEGLMDAVANVRILHDHHDKDCNMAVSVQTTTQTESISQKTPLLDRQTHSRVVPASGSKTVSAHHSTPTLNRRISASDLAVAAPHCHTAGSPNHSPAFLPRPSPIRMVDVHESINAAPTAPRSRIIKSIPPVMPHTSVEGSCNLALSVNCYTEMGLPLEIAQGLYECGVRILGTHQRQLLSQLQQLMGASEESRGASETWNGASSLQVTCLKTPSGPGTTATVCAHLLQQVLLYPLYNEPSYVAGDGGGAGELHPVALVLCPTRTEAEDMGDLARALAYHCGVAVHTAVGGTKMQQQQRRDMHSDPMCFALGSLVIGTTGRVLDMLRRGRLNVSNVRVTMLMESAALAGTSDFQAQAQLLMTKMETSLKQVVMLTPTELLPTMLQVYEQVLFAGPPNPTTEGMSTPLRMSPLSPGVNSVYGGSGPASPSLQPASLLQASIKPAGTMAVKLNPNAPAFGGVNWAKFCPGGSDLAPQQGGEVPRLAGASLEIAPSLTSMVINQLQPGLPKTSHPSSTSSASSASGIPGSTGAGLYHSKDKNPVLSLVLLFVGNPEAPLSVILQPIKPAMATTDLGSLDSVSFSLIPTGDPARPVRVNLTAKLNHASAPKPPHRLQIVAPSARAVIKKGAGKEVKGVLVVMHLRCTEDSSKPVSVSLTAL